MTALPAARQQEPPVSDLPSVRRIRTERLAIGVLASAYLIAFNRVVPHGDALRIVRQIENKHLIWNPNHLTFDPVGYGWFALLQAFGAPISALDSFEIISGVSTIVSLLIFHALLVRLRVTHWMARALALLGLFASKAFLSMAISQYYFMLQMPFLLATLYFAIRFTETDPSDRVSIKSLYGMGVCSAVAGTITFNNVLLVAALGVAVGLDTDRGRPHWSVARTARLWGAAAAVGVPVFLLGYALSNSSVGFFSWLLSYQGESESRLNELYGIVWTPTGVVVSLVRAGFNLLIACIVETVGMGRTLQALSFRESLEFVPETGRFLLALSLIPIVGSTVALLLWLATRAFFVDRWARIAVAWIGAYFAFNTLWGSSGDQFLVQSLPVLWVLLLAYLGLATHIGARPSAATGTAWKWSLLVLTVPALLTVNTLQTVGPVSLVDLEARRAEHMALLRDGDLEIAPGWDTNEWMELDPKGPSAGRLTLMQMALEREASDTHIQQLPAIVARQLDSGKRVVVARLYDKDHGINPWYALSRLGWPRARIQKLLSHYCQKEIGAVGDVVFRELVPCVNTLKVEPR
jgi:hypothetical protein